MPFLIHPHRRFPVPCSVTYNAGPFLKLPLAYFSGFWLLITLFVLSSSPAYAEWVKIRSSDTLTYYADPETLRRAPFLLRLRRLRARRKNPRRAREGNARGGERFAG